jgi:ADP-ribose pyrophosphatase
VVLVEQARLPAALAGLAPVQVEIVAGLVEPGETPEAVARREVREETGLDLIGRPRKITHMVTTPGHSTETVHLFCGRVDAGRAGGVHGLAAEHEDLRVLALPASDLAAWMADGRIANAIALVGGFWLLANREALRHDWAAAA